MKAYDPKLIHPLFPHFYLGQDCPYYLDLDNYITLDGIYPVKNLHKLTSALISSLATIRILFPGVLIKA